MNLHIFLTTFTILLYHILLRVNSFNIDISSTRQRKCRAGKRKQRRIPVIITNRLSSEPPLNESVNSNLDKLSYSRKNKNKQAHNRNSKINFFNLIPINTTSSNDLTNETHHFKSQQLANVIYFNSQSVRNKPILINDLILDSDADLIFITETWLKANGDEVIMQELTPIGYKLYSCPRTTGRGGGICIIYKRNIKVKFEDIVIFQSFECLKVNAFNTIFLCIYHPPPSTKNASNNREFINDTTDLLETYCNDGNRLIILGDFNLHFNDDTETYTKSMKTLLANHHLHQLIDTPTHKNGHVLDWLITHNNSNSINHLHVTDKMLSDHYIVSFTLNATKPSFTKSLITSRNLRAINKNAFNDHLQKAFANPHHPHDLAEVYNKTLSDALDHHAPLQTRSITVRPSAPWYTARVKQAKQHRRAAERKWKKTKLTVDREIYVKHVRNVKNVILSERKSYFTEKITNCKNSKTLYKIVNDMKGNPKTSPLPSSVPCKELPEAFGKYFMNKICKIRDDLDNCSHTKDSAVLDDPQYNYKGSTFNTFKEVSVPEVRSIIRSSPPKSCSIDPIPTNLLFEYLDTLSDIITAIINHSLQSGTVPDCYKSAIVCPLLKKYNLDPEELKNYRPVSNLPFISKILEKVVLKQLKEHLLSNNLVEPFQSAYRENHSTESALLKIVNDILLSSDNGKISILALLDLSAAFDTIDHSILFKRLSLNFGISGNVLAWFMSYLTDRSQSVFIHGKKSKVFPLNFGVPQGSVLGPILYTLYTLPLGRVIKSHSFNYHMYADDTQLYKDALPSELPTLSINLENCCTSVKTWMQSNKLKFNDDKTEVLICSTERKLKHITANSVTIADVNTQFSIKAKNLGVILDNYLKMDFHINHIIQTINLELRRISHMKSFLPVDALKTVVTSLILSRLDYCNALLAGLPDVQINKLQRLQNRAARLILGRSKFDSVNEMLITLHWLPIRARIEYKIALFCFHAIHASAPLYIQELIIPYKPTRELRSQNSSRLIVPKSNLKRFGDRSFSKIGPVVWNSLPISVRLSGSVEIFKKRLKTHLFNTYLL